MFDEYIIYIAKRRVFAFEMDNERWKNEIKASIKKNGIAKTIELNKKDWKENWEKFLPSLEQVMQNEKKQENKKQDAMKKRLEAMNKRRQNKQKGSK